MRDASSGIAGRNLTCTPRAYAGRALKPRPECSCRARLEGFVLQYVRCTGGFSSPEHGCEEAAFRVEQASEQPVRAPVFEPLLGPATGEPDVEVAELVEHRGAV